MISSFLDFFITNAEAAPAAAPPPSAGSFQLVIMLLILIFFVYFTVWRPQNKRMKEHKELLNSLTKGDEIVTNGGIVGKLAKITDNYAVLAISDGVEITIQKSAIATVLPKGTLKSI